MTDWRLPCCPVCGGRGPAACEGCWGLGYVTGARYDWLWRNRKL